LEALFGDEALPLWLAPFPFMVLPPKVGERERGERGDVDIEDDECAGDGGDEGGDVVVVVVECPLADLNPLV